jgi:hypothetical protein
MMIGRPGDGRAIDDSNDRNDQAVDNLVRGVCERHPNPRTGIAFFPYPGGDEFGLTAAFFPQAPSFVGACKPERDDHRTDRTYCREPTRSITHRLIISRWLRAIPSPRRVPQTCRTRNSTDP